MTDYVLIQTFHYGGSWWGYVDWRDKKRKKREGPFSSPNQVFERLAKKYDLEPA